jgi:hypothetical protein
MQLKRKMAKATNMGTGRKEVPVVERPGTKEIRIVTESAQSKGKKRVKERKPDRREEDD